MGTNISTRSQTFEGVSINFVYFMKWLVICKVADDTTYIRTD